MSKARKQIKVSVDDELYSELNKLSGDMMWPRSQVVRKILEFSFKHRSPEFAKLFLQLIIDEVNNVFRKEKLSEIERARKYFESEYEIATILRIVEL